MDNHSTLKMIALETLTAIVIPSRHSGGEKVLRFLGKYSDSITPILGPERKTVWVRIGTEAERALPDGVSLIGKSFGCPRTHQWYRRYELPQQLAA